MAIPQHRCYVDLTSWSIEKLIDIEACNREELYLNRLFLACHRAGMTSSSLASLQLKSLSNWRHTIRMMRVSKSLATSDIVCLKKTVKADRFRRIFAPKWCVSARNRKTGLSSLWHPTAFSWVAEGIAETMGEILSLCGFDVKVLMSEIDDPAKWPGQPPGTPLSPDLL